jgi:hypothetical protein
VPAGTWAHIGVIFDGQTLTLYIDGVQDSFVSVVGAGIANQGNDFIAGSGGNADIDTIRMWSIGQTSTYMYEAPWAPDPAAGTTGLVAGYDLSVIPPVDTSGNGHTLTLTAPATSILSAPGVLLSGSAYVDPAEQDLIRCGDTAYTIDAWLYQTSATGNQAIFTSGNLNDPGAVALSVNGGTFQSIRGSTSLSATTAVPLNTWTHVAATYDRTTLTVYVNGVAAGSQAAASIPSLVSQAALIGAYATSAGAQSNFFHGYFQYISVWSIALTATQVQALMYDDPTLQPGCVSNFAFSQTLPVDLNDGLPLTLLGGATLAEQMTPSTSPHTIEEPRRVQLELAGDEQDRAQRNRLRRASAVLRRLEQTRPGGGTAPSLDTLAQLLRAELEAAIPPGTPDEVRQRILREHAERLGSIDAAETPPAGTVTHAIVDDHHVLTFHGPNGPEVVFRAHVDDVDPCVVWWLQFIFTLLSGVASLLGLTAPVTARLNQYVQTLIADFRFMAAASPLFVGTITASTVLSFLGLLYNNGYLWTFFKFCITQLSWWAIGRLVLYVVGLFVPAPSPAKVQFFVSAVQLVYNLTNLLLTKPC